MFLILKIRKLVLRISTCQSSHNLRKSIVTLFIYFKINDLFHVDFILNPIFISLCPISDILLIAVSPYLFAILHGTLPTAAVPIHPLAIGNLEFS